MVRPLVQLVRAVTFACGVVLFGTAWARAESAVGQDTIAWNESGWLTSEPAAPRENENPAEHEIQRQRSKARLHRQILGDGINALPREAAPMEAFPRAMSAVASILKVALPVQASAVPRPRYFAAPRSCLASSDSTGSASRLS